ncbi:major facilitator superfamily domain-containing protein [Hyaloscypha finlandica]|nr:major facilitator superfamily domain-containing protein [Hyaloscypha finlandica]
MGAESYTPSSLETGSFQDKQRTSEPHEIVAVPRHQSLDLSADDTDNPRSWTQKKKVSLGLFVLVSGFVATIGTAIYIAAIPEVQLQFHLTTTQAISPISLYANGLGIGALIATAACEIYGRRIVYRVTLPIALIFTIVGGCSQNFATLAVSRTLAGLFCGPCLTVGVGILNDLWDLSLEKIGTSFAVLFVLFAIWATQIGPMASAGIIEHHSWRWTFWVAAILLGVTAVWSFLVPETYHPQIIRARAKKMGQTLPSRGTNATIFLTAIGRPLHMILVEPIIFPTGLVLAITQSIVMTYYVGYALLFEKVYGFSQFKVGMAFGPLIVGALLAVPVVAILDKLMYQKARVEALRLGKTVAPEKRLYPAMLGSITLPISLFW